MIIKKFYKYIASFLAMSLIITGIPLDNVFNDQDNIVYANDINQADLEQELVDNSTVNVPISTSNKLVVDVDSVANDSVILSEAIADEASGTVIVEIFGENEGVSEWRSYEIILNDNETMTVINSATGESYVVNQADGTVNCPMCAPLLVMGARVVLPIVVRQVGKMAIKQGIKQAAKQAAKRGAARVTQVAAKQANKIVARKNIVTRYPTVRTSVNSAVRLAKPKPSYSQPAWQSAGSRAIQTGRQVISSSGGRQVISNLGKATAGALTINYAAHELNNVGTNLTSIVKVISGMTLYSLAQFYNTTVDELKKANHLTSDIIYPDQQLIVPKKTNTSIAASTSPIVGKSHIVQQGETLWRIAHNAGITVETLKQLNNLVSNTIYPGQQLITQPLSQKSAADIAKEVIASAKITTDNKGNKTITVAQGMTLYSLSKMNNVTVNDLKKWNNLTSDILTIGKVLFLNNPILQQYVVNTTPYPTKTIQIQPGNTVYGLSRQYDMTVAELKKINGLTSDTIITGHYLKVKDRSATSNSSSNHTPSQSDNNNNNNNDKLGKVAAGGTGFYLEKNGAFDKLKAKVKSLFAGRNITQLTPKEIVNLTPEEMKALMPEGWFYSNVEGRVHIKKERKSNIYRVRIDPEDDVVEYRHIHIYDEFGNSLDIDGNIVNYKSLKAHIPYNK